jgi:hypothetical protein
MRASPQVGLGGGELRSRPCASSGRDRGLATLRMPSLSAEVEQELVDARGRVETREHGGSVAGRLPVGR